MEEQDNFTTAKAIKQLQYIESIRSKFKKLQMHFDKEKLLSPTTIKISKEDGSEENNSDPKTMIRQIMQHNQTHFKQS